MKKRKESINIKSIARTCGVSAMTVSRAFRRSHSVDSATRQRILAAAARMNYRPDGRMGRPRKQGAVKRMPARIIVGEKFGGANLYHAGLLGAMERSLAQHKYDCLLRTCDGSYDNFVWLCEALRSEPPLPTMIVGHFPLDQLRALLAISPEALLVDYTDNPQLTRPYDSVGFDNVEAGRIIVRHLIETGRRRILLIKGHPDHVFSVDIEKGYRDILRLHDMEVDKSLIVAVDFTAAGAYQCVLNLIARGLKFDAVFTNDEMALGVMRALAEQGRIIPDDVAVAGCDGLPYGSFTRPSLTTVVMDYAELGELAVERVLTAKKHGKAAMRIRLVPKLAARESTLGFQRTGKKTNHGSKKWDI